MYGATRSGTSYMYDLVKRCARLHVSDWGLGMILAGIQHWTEFRSFAQHEYILFDQQRLLRDLSANILENAYPGFGDQIDLVYKQATLELDEYPALVAMWGQPERSIMCLREPAGYMASAAIKFPSASVGELQEAYIKSLKAFWQAGGDVFEYRAGLTTADYLAFLEPLRFDETCVIAFSYRGRQQPDDVTAGMWEAYHRVKAVTGD